MSDPFIGEIRMFAGNFAPRGYALCDGQLLLIAQNTALFSLLGTIYGGDGATSFGLPDLRGRVPIHAGSGPDLSSYDIGANGGAEQVTLTVNHVPSHTHPLQATDDQGSTPNPSGNVLAMSTTVDAYFDDTPATALSANAIANIGGSEAHTNLMPFLCIHFIIALTGTYPSQN